MKKAVFFAAWLSALPAALAQVSTVSVGYCPPQRQGGAAGNGAGAGSGSGTGNGNGAPPDSTTLGVQPYIDSSAGNYAFNGFFPVSGDRAILNGKSTTTSSMTQEYCASFCQGSNYFAISDGVTCTCGSDPPSGQAVYSPAQSIACPGKGTESCGSPGYAIVYRLSNVGPGGETVIDYTTTNSDGSVSTGKITTNVAPSSASVSLPAGSGSAGSVSVPTGSGAGGSSALAPSTSAAGGGSIVPGSSATSGGGASSTGGSTAPSGTTDPRYPCPALDANLYGLPDGDAYNVQCHANYPGNDLTTPHFDSFSACIAACDNYVPDPNVAGGKSCVAVSYGAGNPGGNCYLKYAIDRITTNDLGFDSASSADYIPVNPVSSAAGGGSSPTASGGNGASSAGSGASSVGSPATIGGNAGSSASATNGAGSQSSTAGGGSNPGASSTSNGGGAVVSPTGNFANYHAIATPASCPNDNDGIRTEPLLSVDYGVNCERQLDGDNLEPLHADTFDTCLGACSLTKGCVGVTWGGGDTPATRDNCNPYSLIRGYTSQALQNALYVGTSVDGKVNATDYQVDICTNPQDPASPGKYIDSLGDEFDYVCGKQIVDGDKLDPLAADSLSACITYCSIFDTCIAVNFNGTGPPEPRTRNCQPFKAFTVGTIANVAGVQYAALNTS